MRHNVDTVVAQHIQDTAIGGNRQHLPGRAQLDFEVRVDSPYNRLTCLEAFQPQRTHELPPLTTVFDGCEQWLRSAAVDECSGDAATQHRVKVEEPVDVLWADRYPGSQLFELLAYAIDVR